MSFDTEKRHHLALLAQARGEHRVDEAALPLLARLNARADAYTTSSCAGRIQLLDLPALGDKAGSVTLGRWHDPPSAEALATALAQRASSSEAWLFAQPPIFHVEARTLPEAEALLALGRAAGFKNVSVRALRPEGALVELASTQRLETPVRDEAHLAWLHPRAVRVFEEGRAKLSRLDAALRQAM